MKEFLSYFFPKFLQVMVALLMVLFGLTGFYYLMNYLILHLGLFGAALGFIGLLAVTVGLIHANDEVQYNKRRML